MNEDVELYYEDAKEKMKKSVNHLSKDFSRLRTGKANPEMLDLIMVEYYGTETPLKQIANINASDYKTLTIQPFERDMVKKVEKAIMDSDLGLNPQNNGETIFINIPPLTEERRKDLVKHAKNSLEDTKISIRSARREANQMIKEAKDEGLSEDEAKEGEDEIQKLTDKYIQKAEDIFEKKQEEIMEV